MIDKQFVKETVEITLEAFVVIFIVLAMLFGIVIIGGALIWVVKFLWI